MNLVQFKMSICSHKRYVNKNLIFLDFARACIAATVQYTYISSTVNPVSIVSPAGSCRLTCCKISDRLYGLISTQLNFPILITFSDSCICVMLNFNSNNDIPSSRIAALYVAPSQRRGDYSVKPCLWVYCHLYIYFVCLTRLVLLYR
jgi:hypothetical protein